MQYPEDSDLPHCATWDQLVFDPHRQNELGSGDLSPQSSPPLYPALATSTVNEQDEFVQNPLNYASTQPVPTPDHAPVAEGFYYHHHGRWYCLIDGCLKKLEGWKSERNARTHVQMDHLNKERLLCAWAGWYVYPSSMIYCRTDRM